MSRILRVFPRRTSYTPTDSMAFVGLPPLMRPARSEVGEVHISTAFSWDMPWAAMLRDAWAEQYPGVPMRLGGPAYPDSYGDGSFTPGLYVKPGITFTSRGCNNHCPWCLVWQREGRLRTIEIKPGNVIQDNCFLETPRAHQKSVFDMLKQQRGVRFAGGFAPQQITASVSDELARLRVAEVFLAADTMEATSFVRQAVEYLAWLRQPSDHDMAIHRVRCYALCGFEGELIEMARWRLETIWQSGAVPFAQLYRPPTGEKAKYSREWQELQRQWTRPAAMFAQHKEGVK